MNGLNQRGNTDGRRGRGESEIGVGSSDTIGGPARKELSLRFRKGEDGRQTDERLNEAAK